jgi:superfamily II DNA or RNA helicase
MSDDYAAFLARKAVRAPERGLKSIPSLRGHLFPFQAHSVSHALRVGAAGLFLDTGLGKTECQLEFCQHGLEATNGRALILTPLAVAQQTCRRAERWGYEARVIREQSEAGPGINICNYDRLAKLDPDAFGAVALDEASILKSFTGKTTRALVDAFRNQRFKLVATATPAPNDHMELGQYSEFLGLMPSNEMLMRWFIADQTEMGRYRLKGHAVNAFWDWMSSWSRMAERPSDINPAFSDEGYDLPAFQVVRHRAKDSGIKPVGDGLFADFNMSATNLHDVKRQTCAARAEVAASLVAASPDEPWIVWCDTNYEADALSAAIPTAVEIRGSMSIDEKEEKLAAFAAGGFKHLLAKPSMCGHGLDWAHCARMVFVGRSYSYEVYYQAVRRCWRFGQRRPVRVDLVLAEGEGNIGQVLDRKADDHAAMKDAMRAAMRRDNESAGKKIRDYEPTYLGRLPQWLQSAA